MGAVYSEILSATEQAGFAPPRRRVSLARRRLLALVLRAAWYDHASRRTSGQQGRAYVIGAGLAGLAAATALAARGMQVTLFEAAGQAGGRCRSYFDPAFDGVIDNGNHLVLSGNHAVHAYLARIGARKVLAGPARAQFAFADLASGARWALQPNDGPLPWWVGVEIAPGAGHPRRRLCRLCQAAVGRQAPDHGRCCWPCRGPLWDRLMHPFLLAALNTEPKEASARLAGAIAARNLGQRRPGLSPPHRHAHLGGGLHRSGAGIPAAQGGQVRLGERLRAITFGAARRRWRWNFPTPPFRLARTMCVVLAVPPWVAQDLVPDLPAPDRIPRHRQRAISNCPAPAGRAAAFWA